MDISTYSKITRVLLGTAIAGASLTTLFYFYQHFYGSKPIHELNELPDVIVSHPVFTMTDETGRKTIQFSSDTLWHYQSDNRSDFTKPVGFYFPTHRGPWQITADQGQAINGDELIYLNGNVWLNQKPSSHNKETTITTQAITVYPNQKIAEGALFVTITQPGFTVTSIGFHADLAKNELKLLNQAKGYYSAAKANEQSNEQPS